MPEVQNIIVKDFAQPAQRHIRILLGQIATTPEDWVVIDDLYFPRGINRFYENIQGIIAEAVHATVDLIVLPELSVPLETCDLLRKWSAQTGGIAVAGSHYHQVDGAYRSRCPVMIAGEVFFTEKLTPAPAEISPIKGNGLTEGNAVHIFKNTRIGNFGVLICSDYLDPELRRNVLGYDIDLLCVPAFQRNSAIYHNRMGIDCEESERGLYIAYANMVQDTFGDGRSAFFGIMDRIFSDKLHQRGITDLSPPQKLCESKVNQDSIILEFDLQNRRPLLGRTVFSRPNVSIINYGDGQASKHTRFLKLIGHADDRYRYISELFVPPAEYQSMVTRLEETKLLFIVGDPGIGKTYTAARLLRDYFDKGFEPIWFTGLEKEERMVQRQTLEGLVPRTKQIIYFEDPFGRTNFERRDAIFTVFGPLIDRLSSVDARVIVTSRKEIFERFTEESLSAKDLLRFKEEMGIVKPSYSAEQLLEILRNLARGRCDWYNDKAIRNIVHGAIHRKELSTPLAIRDLVFTSEDITDSDELLERIGKRRSESALSFATEIQGLPVATKLVFSFIYLVGHQDQRVLTQWYQLAQTALHAVGQIDSVGVTFVEELRTQLGFRVEQFGARLSALRFSHPVYEEAVAQMSVRDNTSKRLMAIVLRIVCAERFALAVDAVFRNAKRFGDFTTCFCLELLENRKDISVEGQVRFGLKILAAFLATKDERYRQLLSQVCSASELGAWINHTKSRTFLPYLFRFAANYEIHLKQEVGPYIRWRRVFTALRRRGALSQLAQTLEWAAIINPSAVQEFLLGLSPRDLRREFLRLTNIEQKRLLELLKNTKFGDTLTNFAAHYPASIAHLHRLNPAEIALVPQNVAIVVDAGAAQAIRKGMNLLPAGIVTLKGEFNEGQIVLIVEEDRGVVGVGISEYNSDEVEQIKGHHSSQIAEILGRFYGNAVVPQYNFTVVG